MPFWSGNWYQTASEMVLDTSIWATLWLGALCASQRRSDSPPTTLRPQQPQTKTTLLPPHPTWMYSFRKIYLTTGFFLFFFQKEHQNCTTILLP